MISVSGRKKGKKKLRSLVYGIDLNLSCLVTFTLLAFVLEPAAAARLPSCSFKAASPNTGRGFSEAEKADILAKHNNYRKQIRQGAIDGLYVGSGA